MLMRNLIECVPNFSEGRNPAVIQAILAAMKMDGVYLLGQESDSDHNRCVVTLVGERAPLQEAVIRGIGKAAELIDLNVHTGAHPRMGATDVVPFIPIEGVTIEDCVAVAKHVGAEVWNRFKVPVYLYEAAATSPERIGLENIRRGQFEGLREAVKTDPARRPDFGGPELHASAGATVVGARKPLIAFNVFLNTTDVDVAKKIAKAVRFSTGGLRFVKGAGFSVRGLAQVSMNLTDYEQTSVARVFEFVKREAARYGVGVLSSEIVGLIPKRALEDAAEWFLQVENFDSSMILENRMAAVMSGKMAVGGLQAGIAPFIEQLAAPTATPGGGSAAAAAGAIAAALGHMVASMSRGKKAYLQHEAALTAAITQLSSLKQELQNAVDSDAESFNVVMKAFKAQREADSADTNAVASAEAAVTDAMKGATLVPLSVAEAAHDVGSIIASLNPITNPRASSDLVVGHLLAEAAKKGALANVEINLAEIKDAAFMADVCARVNRLT